MSNLDSSAPTSRAARCLVGKFYTAFPGDPGRARRGAYIYGSYWQEPDSPEATGHYRHWRHSREWCGTCDVPWPCPGHVEASARMEAAETARRASWTDEDRLRHVKETRFRSFARALGPVEALEWIRRMEAS